MDASVSAFADADQAEENGQGRFAMAGSRLTPDMMYKYTKKLKTLPEKQAEQKPVRSATAW